MATDTPSHPPRRGMLVVVAAAIAVVVAVALIVASQLSSGSDDGAGDRAAAVTAAAPAATTAAATPSTAAEAPATSAAAAGATTGSDAAGQASAAASTLPYVEDVQKLLAGIPQDGTILGDPNAPVTITEYADLRCPSCRSWETGQLDTLLQGPIKSGDAKLDLQVLSILGPDSDRAATGGWAAEAQNKLWPFAMLWYYNQGPESEAYATDDYQRAIAAGAGLDVQQFDQARADPATAAKAQAAYDAAVAAGFGGTPAFVVSGPGGTFPFVDGRVPTADTVIDAVKQAAGS